MTKAIQIQTHNMRTGYHTQYAGRISELYDGPRLVGWQTPVPRRAAGAVPTGEWGPLAPTNREHAQEVADVVAQALAALAPDTDDATAALAAHDALVAAGLRRPAMT